MAASLSYRWEGGVMRPLPRHAHAAAQQFDEGNVYDLEPSSERSKVTHDHYFACIATAFENLPELYKDRFADPEDLRKWCLIKRNYRNEKIIVASSKRQASEIASLSSWLDEFAVVHVRGKIVAVYTAKTQRMKRNSPNGMDKQEFQASKQAVLEECAFMIGVTVEELAQHHQPAAKARELEDA